MRKSSLFPFMVLTIFSGCTLPPMERLPGCRYSDVGTEERVFVLPTFEEYTAGSGEPIYSAPERSARIGITSLAYRRELFGKRYKRLGVIEGRDGRYVRWLLEDCRLFFTRDE